MCEQTHGINSRTKIRHSRFSSVAARLLWFLAISIILYLLFSFALPQDLSRNTPIYSRLVVIAFFGRVLEFHLALVLAIVTAAALPLRRWKLAVLAGIVAGLGFAFQLPVRLPGRR
jgi:phage shock protein PspC (stress-responsive transcriptional regulator)